MIVADDGRMDCEDGGRILTKFAITEENASEEFGLIVDNVLGPSYLALLTK